MQVITQQQLQCVGTGLERQFGCGAGVTKVNVVLIGRYRQAQIRQTRVNDQMMMA